MPRSEGSRCSPQSAAVRAIIPIAAAQVGISGFAAGREVELPPARERGQLGARHLPNPAQALLKPGVKRRRELPDVVVRHGQVIPGSGTGADLVREGDDRGARFSVTKRA